MSLSVALVVSSYPRKVTTPMLLPASRVQIAALAREILLFRFIDTLPTCCLKLTSPQPVRAANISSDQLVEKSYA